ncbi:MAG: hypothetical protein HY377_01850 [Candidatus Blackburnbacteria bacterium]|nr:hypothetical protein [Candidatus Blackburnbacteria bacterium]
MKKLLLSALFFGLFTLLLFSTAPSAFAVTTIYPPQQTFGGTIITARLEPSPITTEATELTLTLSANTAGYFQEGGKYGYLFRYQSDPDEYQGGSGTIVAEDTSETLVIKRKKGGGRDIFKEGQWTVTVWRGPGLQEKKEETIIATLQYISLPPGARIPSLTAPARVQSAQDLRIPITIEDTIPGKAYTLWFEGDKSARSENVFTAQSDRVEGTFVSSVTSEEKKELCMEIGTYTNLMGVTCHFKTPPISIVKEPIVGNPGTASSRPVTGVGSVNFPSITFLSLGCGDQSLENAQITDEEPIRPPSQQSSATQYISTAIGCIPIGNTNEFAAWVLRWAIGISGGVAFLLMLFAGFQIMTAAGNPEKLQHGRELLTAAISGLILIIFSVFLLRLIGVQILNLPGFGTSP